MKTAAAQQKDQEQIPSTKGHATGKQPLQDLRLRDLAEVIHGERRAAQTSVYSMKAVLDLLDMVQCSLSGDLEQIDLGGIIHTLNGLVEDAIDSLTMIEERTREIQELC